MSEKKSFEFIPTDAGEIMTWMAEKYQEITGVTIQPGSPERLFIQWVAAVVIQERVLTNYAANQNLPSYAEGENLDAVAELFYKMERPAAKPATCKMRFIISEEQTFSVWIPRGTRVTDAGGTLEWETVEDVAVEAGNTTADVTAVCLTPGAAGNGYVEGQINTIMDLYPYHKACANITESGGGSDQATDKEFYELLRLSMDAFSCAGPQGSYIYYARQVSTQIADVAANSPGAGEVAIYVLMDDGNIAGDEVKSAVLAACSREDRRPMTDHVSVEDPEQVEYDINFTFYIKADSAVSATDVEAQVESAVREYVAWQSGKLGRDINPDELIERVRAGGNVKRLAMTGPAYTKLNDGKDDGQVPQVAKVGTVTITNGGYEDE